MIFGQSGETKCNYADDTYIFCMYDFLDTPKDWPVLRVS